MKKKLAIAFFFSGAAALVYQVLWARMLGLVFGNTTYAISTVLAAFMGGMALGSYFMGRYTEKSGAGPVKTLAYMEAAIGVYCALTPLLFAAAGRGYILAQQSFELSAPAITLLRFVLSSAILLFPTFLMGGTLPVMTKALKAILPADELSGAIGFFYGINTLGAVFGVVFSAFVSIAYFGVNATLAIAAGVNLAIAGFVYLLGLGEKIAAPVPAAETTAPAADPKLARLALAAAAVSGFSSMICEVAWTRSLSMVIGMSVYAFATMLAAFLAGIAAGSFIFTRFLEMRVKAEGKEGLLAVGVMLGAAGVLVLTTIPVFNHLPLLFLRFYKALSGSFGGMLASQILISFVIMAVPAALFGLMFPMLIKIYSLAGASAQRSSSSVGRIYASNTLGCIAGALLAGFALISLLGLEGSIRAAGFVSVAAALVVLFLAKDQLRLALPITGLLIFAAAPQVIAVGSWDNKAMMSGVYLSAPQLIESAKSQGISLSESLRQELEAKEPLYFKNGANFSVGVTRDKYEGYLSLLIDGKVDASTNYLTDMNTQVLSGHLPLLLANNPKRVLVIGLASGITLGAVARYPVAEIDCVEIEPAMVKAAGLFEQWNHSVLKDPRVRIIHNDGRNFLLSTRKKYDVIISEPSNPWISAASPLFTREYFSLIRQRLAPGGVFCQWMQLYGVNMGDYKTVINTMNSEFPDVSLWNPYGYDTLAIAAPGKFSVDYQALEKKFPLAGADLAALGIKNPSGLLVKFLMTGAELDNFIKGAGLNTDNRPRIEFSAPKSLYAASFAQTNRQALLEHIQPVSPHVSGLKGALSLAREYLAAGNFIGAEKEFSLLAQKGGGKAYGHLGYALQRQGKLDEAALWLEKAVAAGSSSPENLVNLSQISLAKNDAAKALVYAQKALAAAKSALSYNQMGMVQLMLGKAQEAAKNFSGAYKTEPSFIPAYVNEAMVYIDFLKTPSAALEVLNRAVGVDPENADVFFQMGRALRRMGMREQAAASFNQAIYINRSYRTLVSREMAGGEATGAKG